MTIADEAAAQVEHRLRHIVLVGGTVADWDLLGDELWTHRLADLGKVADHVGASWLTMYPYEGGEQARGVASPDAARRSDLAGSCTVVATAIGDGRRRLVDVVRTLQRDRREITEEAIAEVLNAPAEADADLVVVLGPAHRLPPSLVWELAYSELVFVDVSWEHLQPRHLEDAIDAFSRRQRRFGGLD